MPTTNTQKPKGTLSERILRDLRALPWLGTALCLILLPTLLPAAWPTLKPGLFSVFLHLAGLLLLPCLLGLRVRRVLGLCWPVVCVVPVAVFCYATTHQQPSEWFFLVLRETNTKEASVFVPQITGFVLLLAILVSIYAWLLSRPVFKDMRLGPLSACAVVACGLLIPAGKAARSGVSQAWKEEAWRITENYPVGTALAAVKAARLSHQIANRGDAGKSLVVRRDAPPLPAGKREIHMLVIGETARAASFQINGYERETTPFLAKLPGVLCFKDVIAPAPVTTISVPVLLTPTDATCVPQSSHLPSVMNVFKNAGFRVYWISTQLKHGFWDTRCSTYSNDADESRFLSGKLALSGEPREAAQDGALLPVVKEVLDRGEEKVLFVLHTMGSHAIYADRYPPEFNHFPADAGICAAARSQILDSTLTPERVEHLRNSYDNSIRYTDFVLSRLIGMLGDQDAVASLYYISDHGENGGDAPMMPFGHGTLTSDVLRVPLVVWLSEDYQALRPRQAGTLRAHGATPISSDTTFHTLVDLAGLSCDLFKPSRSVASTEFVPGPRMVTALDGRIADYDRQIAPAESKRKGWRPLSQRVAKNGE